MATYLGEEIEVEAVEAFDALVLTNYENGQSSYRIAMLESPDRDAKLKKIYAKLEDLQARRMIFDVPAGMMDLDVACRVAEALGLCYNNVHPSTRPNSESWILDPDNNNWWLRFVGGKIVVTWRRAQDHDTVLISAYKTVIEHALFPKKFKKD